MGLAGLLANGRLPELFKHFAPHFLTHSSLLFTDTVEPSVPKILGKVTLTSTAGSPTCISAQSSNSSPFTQALS